MANKLGKNSFFDIKMGSIGAIFLGTIVFFVNYNYGWSLAFLAAGKQAIYTFFIGGVMTKIAENIALQFNARNKAIFMATLVPTILTSALTYGMHSLKGTPEPFASTVPTFVFAPIGFYGWALRKRKEQERKK